MIYNTTNKQHKKENIRLAKETSTPDQQGYTELPSHEAMCWPDPEKLHSKEASWDSETQNTPLIRPSCKPALPTATHTRKNQNPMQLVFMKRTKTSRYKSQIKHIVGSMNLSRNINSVHLSVPSNKFSNPIHC